MKAKAVNEYWDPEDDGLSKIKMEAKELSAEEGCVQHVNEIRPGVYRIEDWYDCDQTVASYENGNIIRESLNEGFATDEGRKINQIASILGYDDFEEFIGDNPGCYQVITEWVDETFSDQLAEEDLQPEALENLDLYTAAEKSRENESSKDEEDKSRSGPSHSTR